MTAPAAQVIVVDDQEYIGQILDRLLRACDDLGFGGWLPSPEGLGERIAAERERDHRVVVVLDYNIPGFEPLDVLRDIRAQFPDVRVVIFSGEVNGQEEAMAAGASACIGKDSSPGELLEVLRKSIV